MNPNKLIAIYARVSTARQEEEQTVLTQLQALHEYSKENNLTIVKEYVDEGWSGDILARPALDNLRQDGKRKIWDAVLIYDPDRLARRYSYQELVMDELKEAGVEVLFITVGTPKNSEDKILHGVRGLFAEYERTKITERFRLGKIRKVKEGNIMASIPLYGYDYVPKQENQPGHYRINEAEAEVVRMVFKWAADEGLSQRKISVRLQEMGIKPRFSKRGVWNGSTLASMLKHRGYIGEAHWGKTYCVAPLKPKNQEQYKRTKKSSSKVKPESEWYKIPIPPIIDKDLFERARIQIARNYDNSMRNRKYPYLLANKLFCLCGIRRVGGGPHPHNHYYYRCNNRVLLYPLPPTCKETGVNVRIADQIVWEKIVELMSSPKLMMEQAARFKSSQVGKVKDMLPQKDRIEKEMNKLRSQEERYNAAYGAGLFTLEQLSKFLAPVRKRLSLLQSQCKELDEVANAEKLSALDEPSVNRLAEEAKKLLCNSTFELKRSIVLKVIDKVVGTKHHLAVTGCIPLDINVGLCPQYGDGVGTTTNYFQETKGIPFSFDIVMPDYNEFYQRKR